MDHSHAGVYSFLKHLADTFASASGARDWKTKSNFLYNECTYYGLTVITILQNDIAKIYTQMFAFQAQLLDPSLVTRSLAFLGFQSTWLIRLVDPKKTHPSQMIAWVFLSFCGPPSHFRGLLKSGFRYLEKCPLCLKWYQNSLLRIWQTFTCT